VILANGTVIEPCAEGSRIVLPSGEVVEGRPHATDAYRATAARLGYGPDTLAMCRDHDPLHARLCDWLGLLDSFALRDAAGLLDPKEQALALLEEEAVLALQKFIRALDFRRAGCRIFGGIDPPPIKGSIP
jgi:hypothetical protein